MEKKVFRFKKMSNDLKSFVEWLEWNYKKGKGKNVEEWDEDESYYWDEKNLELILYNEEFSKEYEEYNEEYVYWIKKLKNNLK